MATSYIFVDLDKQRKLKFDFNALADVEAVLGAGVGYIFKQENMGFNAIRALYWAGLKWQDKGLTMERTGKILQKCIQEEKTDMKKLGEDLTEAMFASGIIKRKPQVDPDAEDEDDTLSDVEDEDTEEDEKN